MIELHFPNLHPNDLLDRLFNPIYKLFPTLVGIDVTGDDGAHSLPFSNMEDSSKTIQFLKHIYFNNGDLALMLDTGDEGKKQVKAFYNEENNHTLDIEHDNLDALFRSFHPLFGKKESTFYLGDAFGKDLGDAVYISEMEEPTISKEIVENYQFIEQSAPYLSSVQFTPQPNGIYSYDYSTFLPENIRKEELILLFLFVLGRKFSSLSKLKQLMFSDDVVVSTERVKTERCIDFELPRLALRGAMNPVEKYIQLN